jgi:hypothetical protein
VPAATGNAQGGSTFPNGNKKPGWLCLNNVLDRQILPLRCCEQCGKAEGEHGEAGHIRNWMKSSGVARVARGTARARQQFVCSGCTGESDSADSAPQIANGKKATILVSWNSEELNTGGKGKVVTSAEVKAAIQSIGINWCARGGRFDRKNFIRKLICDMPVKRNSYNEFVRWLRGYNSAVRS